MKNNKQESTSPWTFTLAFSNNTIALIINWVNIKPFTVPLEANTAIGYCVYKSAKG